MNYTLTINGQAFAVSVAQAAQNAPAAPLPPTPAVTAAAPLPPAEAPAPACLVAAGQSGTVERIYAAIGQPVAAGAPLALVSGHTATAPRTGLVKQILVNRNTLVRADDILLVLK